MTTLPRLLIPPLLALALFGQDADLERVRQVNLERAATMPNFVADEISRRSEAAPGSSKWRFLDTIEAEITVHGTQLARDNLRRNGKPWNRGDSGFGFLPATGFGAELRPLFDPDCPTKLEAADRQGAGRAPLLVYRFTSPPDGCFSVLFAQRPYNAARAGRVLIEPSSGRAVRFEEDATGFPADYNFVRRNQVMTWGYVKTASGPIWLPTSAEFIWTLPNGLRYQVAVAYRNHRHFEAVTSVSFAAPGAPSPPPPAKSLDGVWRSQGYGSIYMIQGQQVRTFEVTATTCVAGGNAAAKPGAANGREAAFQQQGGDIYFVRSGGEEDHKRLHVDGSASDIRIDRLERLPEICGHPAEDTPPGNFEVFARTWAENYISFDLKQADWTKIIAENRPKVTAQTTPAQLFDILAGMIAPFGDAHASINARSLKREFSGFRPGSDRAIKGGDSDKFISQRVRSLFAITERQLQGPLRKFCNDQIAYGHVDRDTGYLRVQSFNGYSRNGVFADGMAALDAALDTIFSDPSLKSLVIDVRINFGGADPYGLAIACRLATGEYLAYAKEARANPGQSEKWTPSDPSLVHPSSRPGFRGPVVELIGPLTISAGETFTQALMGRTPHITRIGENTQGVFSDVLERRLPNGWRFGLPNEVYRTPEGAAFDGSGIPPDEAVPVFADSDVAAGRDPGLAKAREILRNSR
jgi:hypothetical protein